MKRAALVVLLVARAQAAPFEDTPTVRAMKDELARAMAKLELPGSPKPYYLAYTLFDKQQASVTASFGAIVASHAMPQRHVEIDLRVGDTTFDNSNVAGGDRSRAVTLPLEDDYDAVRHELWLATDRQYKHALETLERKRAVAKAETKGPDDADAFSKESPSHVVDDHALSAIDKARLEVLAKKLSAVFRANSDAYEGRVDISAVALRSALVSSEGTASLQSTAQVRIDVNCATQADDGMTIHDSLAFFAETVDQLPPEAELVAQVEKLSRELSAARSAPIVDDYAGPLVFEDVAAGQLLRVLLAESFSGTPAPKGDRPGTRAGGESELVGKIGQRILPAGTTVIDDPTLKKLGKVALAGATQFDEEGMPTQKVSLVENGTFKRFLMSRIPRKGFEHSNGHALSTPYSGLRAHPMNLIVSSQKAVANGELRKRALAAAKEQGLKYILVVDKLDFRASHEDLPADSTLPRPEIMRRVYLDGHEELVRGAGIGALPLHSLKDVVAMGATPTVYNYAGGGGGYEVAIVAPPLLFRDVDVKKPTNAQRKPPLVPRPKP
jgi:hypothetical protein